MARRLWFVVLTVIPGLLSCGGSSSETPWPLEPGPGELDRPPPTLHRAEPAGPSLTPPSEDMDFEEESEAPSTWGKERPGGPKFPGAETDDAGAR